MIFPYNEFCTDNNAPQGGLIQASHGIVWRRFYTQLDSFHECVIATTYYIPEVLQNFYNLLILYSHRTKNQRSLLGNLICCPRPFAIMAIVNFTHTVGINISAEAMMARTPYVFISQKGSQFTVYIVWIFWVRRKELFRFFTEEYRCRFFA